MTRILEQAFEQAKQLPRERQDEVGEMILSYIEQEASELRLSPAQVAEVERRLKGAVEIVPDEEVEAFFRKHAE
jgi:hypothetical protein